MDIRQYSEAKIGEQWNETDHLFIVTQLSKIDRLAQQVYDQAVKELRDRRAAAGLAPEPLEART